MTSTERIENSENTCVVCFKVVEIYSIGECDHPVCYECSTRMRVLCLQVECPICRQEMPKVIFTEDVRPFREIKDVPYLMDKKYKICFENADIQKAFNKLLLHVCNRCHSKPTFRTFNNLHDHMKREHELFYCNLCVDNLKIFSAERRCYTRQELAQHRRKGDSDDRSHRGHPLCQFCDQRYMDNDELFRHLRRDHFFCHFCDADGLHQYYSSYECLREHYRAEHYLCEEENCVEEKFTSVFRTDIDLKAHKAQVHGRLLSKAAAKQARTLEVQFTLAPRASGDPSGRRGAYRGGRGRHGFRDDMLGAVGGFDAADGDDGSAEDEGFKDFCQSQQQITLNMDSTREFPTLSGGPSRKSATSSDSSASNGFALRSSRSAPAQRNQFSGRCKAPLAITDENFPALDGTPSPAVNTLHLSVNSHDSSRGAGKGGFNQISASAASASAPHRNLSIQVNHSQNSGMVCVASSSRSNPPGRGPQVSSVKTLSSQDFPALGGNKGSQRNVARSHPPSGSCRDSMELSARFASSCRTSNKKDTVDPMASNFVSSSRNDTYADDSKQKKKLNKGENSSQKVEPSQHNGRAKNSEKYSSKEMKPSNSSSSSSQSFYVPIGHGVADSGSQDNVVNGNVKSVDKTRTGVGTEGEHHPPPPPPGFTPTPPGFTAKPPPGFTSSSSAPSLLQVSSEKEGWRNGLKNGPVGTFLSPPEFDARNVALVSKVGSVLGESGTSSLDEFRQLSVRFRKGSLSAHAYYHHCLSNMGSSNFDSIFPELLVLLPDIQKQQELWKVHEEEALPQHHGWKRWGLECCNSCGQVLSVKDLEFHRKSHALEANFPALPSSGNASFPPLTGFSSVATSTR